MMVMPIIFAYIFPRPLWERGWGEGAELKLSISVGLARLASFFLLRSQKKETKEKATLSRLTLCCSASWAAIELTLTSHTKRGLLRSSNMRLPKAPMKLVLLGATEWGSVEGDKLHKQSKVFTYG
ncbi:MAG: hypothetical protein B7Y16_02420 [Methylotenera sp. 24-45-7]|jgi:hypothetical protein|nr:MAG: hypothetical protein B7Y72_05255 [Mehylophilales bacterium 35-46-6]OYY82506.1 MAG: hypothetical protein B7Y34_02600 [Methylophilales bacterium 16-45-9]OYZ41353.1 MAG: hypothetical protein B7Y16_02420 [Methylotenera sp. 24-45-7]OZA09313.1 MAG: hypothetical protein B7X97_03055 [Methylotenera sp. 17-45-7]OZA53813.1 MAG: hypothetical protein B7X73_03080 [Methylophilales bacterium 39-45-7]HQS37059.1 hypothetical protein [Methylotenera sp.]